MKTIKALGMLALLGALAGWVSAAPATLARSRLGRLP